MAKLKLTLACGDYDFLRPLINGEIQPQGIELNVLTMPSPERHGRMLRHEEFDVCELSLIGYLVSRDKGCGYNAIPVFPHRRFRHQYMVKRTGCGIEKPSDLNGKRVALDTLQNSAGLWMRGILQDHYGVDLKTIEWWCQEEEDIPFEPAAWMNVKRVPQGKNIDQMLFDGELEASLYPETLPSIRNGNPESRSAFSRSEESRDRVLPKRRLLPDHAHGGGEESDPREPSLGRHQLGAGLPARQTNLLRRNSDPRSFALVWVQDLMREQKEIFGADPWPYNLEDNRKALEAVIRYEFEQGMIKKNPEVEELFFAPSLQRIQHYV